jgi:hypothetical protein
MIQAKLFELDNIGVLTNYHTSFGNTAAKSVEDDSLSGVRVGGRAYRDIFFTKYYRRWDISS